MTTLPESTQYRLCRALIARLREDAVLAPLVYEEPWDRADQAQTLANAASLPGSVVVAVLPQPMRDPYPIAKTGVFALPLAVAVLTQRNGSATLTAQEICSRVMERVLISIYRWHPEEYAFSQQSFQMDGITEIAAAEYQGLDNLVGLGLMLSKKERLGGM